MIKTYAKDRPDVMRLHKKILVPVKIEEYTDPDGNDGYRFELLGVVDTGQDLTDVAVKTALIVQANKDIAKDYRDALVDSDISLLNAAWQVDLVARERMGTVIDTATRNGYAETETVKWILADNTTRDTTASELGQVLDAYALRMQNIFQQYNAWRGGSMTESFEYVEGE
jgi:hypothetical protein